MTDLLRGLPRGLWRRRDEREQRRGQGASRRLVCSRATTKHAQGGPSPEGRRGSQRPRSCCIFGEGLPAEGVGKKYGLSSVGAERSKGYWERYSFAVRGEQGLRTEEIGIGFGDFVVGVGEVFVGGEAGEIAEVEGAGSGEVHAGWRRVSASRRGDLKRENGDAELGADHREVRGGIEAFLTEGLGGEVECAELFAR